MRIIAGRLKGRRLEAARGTRPTGDRVREALFSMLGGRLEGTFVDAYAGSGAVGLEALSRGARAVLVERDEGALEALRRNLESVGATGAVVIEGDVLRALKRPEEEPRAFGSPPVAVSWIFADPPYDYGPYAKLLRTLGASPLVGPETLVVLEHRRGLAVPAEGFDVVRQATYGETTLSFLRPSSRARASESATSVS